MTPLEIWAEKVRRIEAEHHARVRAIDRTSRLFGWLLLVVALWALVGCAEYRTIVANWPTCSDPCRTGSCK